MADPTTGEKAARLGLTKLRGEWDYWWADEETGATRVSRDHPTSAVWSHFEDWRSWPTDVAAIDALYAERFPILTPHSGTPDYRAALERLERAGSAVVSAYNDETGSMSAEADAFETFEAALTLARKVLE